VTARRQYTAEEVDAAVEALTDPQRLRHAQEVGTHAAPALQRVVNQALEEGGWFQDAHQGQITRAAAEEDPDERLRAFRVLVAEEARLGMLVGVTVGFELARELEARAQGDDETEESENA
jgi:hypothetical protein